MPNPDQGNNGRKLDREVRHRLCSRATGSDKRRKGCNVLTRNVRSALTAVAVAIAIMAVFALGVLTFSLTPRFSWRWAWGRTSSRPSA